MIKDLSDEREYLVTFDPISVLNVYIQYMHVVHIYAIFGRKYYIMSSIVFVSIKHKRWILTLSSCCCSWGIINSECIYFHIFEINLCLFLRKINSFLHVLWIKSSKYWNILKVIGCWYIGPKTNKIWIWWID